MSAIALAARECIRSTHPQRAEFERALWARQTLRKHAPALAALYTLPTRKGVSL